MNVSLDRVRKIRVEIVTNRKESARSNSGSLSAKRTISMRGRGGEKISSRLWLSLDGTRSFGSRKLPYNILMCDLRRWGNCIQRLKSFHQFSTTEESNFRFITIAVDYTGSLSFWIHLYELGKQVPNGRISGQSYFSSKSNKMQFFQLDLIGSLSLFLSQKWRENGFLWFFRFLFPSF